MLISLGHLHSLGVRGSIQDRINDFLLENSVHWLNGGVAMLDPIVCTRRMSGAACCLQGSRHNYVCLRSKHLEPQLGSC